MGAGVVIVVIAVLLTAVSGSLGSKRAKARTPAGVVRRISKPGARYSIQLTGLMAGATGTWNPSKPWGAKNWLYGPGSGTYWLEGDEVHLDWTPEHGEAHHFVGPIPEAADLKSPEKRKIRRIGRTVLGIYLVFAAAGFVTGYELSSGTSTHRSTIGAFSAIAGYLAAYVILVTILGTLRVRRGRTSVNTPSEASDSDAQGGRKITL
ncbi:MAG TPA: hypothetical protein VHG72_18175 [Polyangia bacterium]|nr:hypothetical protein [Mycobacteriales bacterium]HVZ88903.1 hypothetical protein [Polyangia bacterium]